MKVVLAEKPDQARKLAAPFKHSQKQGYIEIEPCSTFPKGAYVVNAIGHLCTLVDAHEYNEAWEKWDLNTLPIIPVQFKHKIVSDKSKAFNIIKERLKDSKVSEIYIATDPAREGEYIARIIIQMSGVDKPIKRIWTSSLTPQAIKKAFENPIDGEQTKALFNEALARAYSDWLLGINASRLYTILLGKRGSKGVFSVGRVQTPLLSLIAKRHFEIENFKPQKYFEVTANFQTNDETIFTGKLVNEQGILKFDSKEDAERLLQLVHSNAIVESFEKEAKSVPAPLLFNLSGLQAKANEKYKISPADTLSIAQGLYEKGYISYPRSESTHITENEAVEIPMILERMKALTPFADLIKIRADFATDKRYVNAQKVSDHYAILTTENVPSLSNLTEREQQIYELIALSVIATQYEPAKFNVTTITLKSNEYTFKASGKQLLEEGWRALYYKRNENDSEEDEQLLPLLKEGENVAIPKIEVHEKVTKAPKPYTEGQLITLMRTAGRTIENAELEKELDTKLASVSLGTEATRASMIQTLKDREYIVVKKNIVHITEKGITLINAVSGTVLANAEMTAKWESVLTRIGKGEASPATFIDKAKELTTHLVNKACKEYEDWNVVQVKPVTIAKCPKCNKHDVIERKDFYGCAGFKEDNCNFRISKKILGKSISQSNIKKLCENGKTLLIKDFKNKEGKKFDAYLTLDTAKNVKFEFPKKAVTKK